MLGALYYAKSQGGDYYDLRHMWDFLEALAHVVDPSSAECLGELADCIEYPPSAGFIGFAPQDPYTQPDYTPDGYLNPPFRITQEGDPDITLFYLQVGDVMAVNPPITAGIDYPRFRVTVVGTREVELHFVTYPTGGNVLVTVDDNPLSLVVVDLERDLTVIPPESAVEIIHEVNTVGEGEHHIDVTFVPTLDADLVPIGFGGGIRNVVVCGMDDDVPYRIRQKPDEPCIIQESIDGETTWQDRVDLALCPPNLVDIGGITYIYDPISGTYTPPTVGDEDTPVETPPPEPRPESTADDRKCAAARNAVQVLLGMHQQVFSTYFAGIVVAVIVTGLLTYIAFTLGIGIPVLFANAQIFTLLGLALSLTTSSFTEEIQDELTCILLENATDSGGVVTFDFGAVQGEIDERTDLAMWGAIDVYVTIIGEGGLNLAGATTSVTDPDCSNCELEWCIDINFATSDYGFAPTFAQAPEYTGVYTGSGWRSGANGCGDGQCTQLYIFRSLMVAPTLRKLEVWTEGSFYPSAPTPPYTDVLTVWGATFNLDEASPHVWEGEEEFLSTISTGGGSYVSGGGGGHGNMVTITRIRATGIGEKPMIGVDCEPE